MSPIRSLDFCRCAQLFVTGKAGEFIKPLCSHSTLGAGNGKFHMLRGARSDPHKDADFPIATENKQQCRARDVLGWCSCFQKKAVDVREPDLLPNIAENRIIHIACPCLHHRQSERWGNTGQLDKLRVMNCRNSRKCVITDRSRLSCSVASQVQVSPKQAAVFMLFSPSQLPPSHTHTHSFHSQLVIPYC